MPKRIEEIVMAQHRTYLIETTNALFSLVVMEKEPGGPYSASYIGTHQKVELPWVDNPGLQKKNLDGAAEGVDFNALVAMCHREIAQRGGEIVSIEEISGDDEF
jgi:hypothetical protein